MGESERYPSYTTCVADALSASPRPLSIDALVAQVGRQRPIGGGARGAIYRVVKQLYQAVSVAPSQIGWFSHLLHDNSFRHPLSPDEMRRGYLLLDELEHAMFFPEFFQNQSSDDRIVTVELFGGPTVTAQAAIERKTWSLRLGRPSSPGSTNRAAKVATTSSSPCAMPWPASIASGCSPTSRVTKRSSAAATCNWRWRPRRS